MRVVRVYWIDSTSYDAWDSLEQHKDAGHLISSVGHLAGETEDFLILVMNLDQDSGDCSQSLRIPKGCIKRIKPLI